MKKENSPWNLKKYHKQGPSDYKIMLLLSTIAQTEQYKKHLVVEIEAKSLRRRESNLQEETLKITKEVEEEFEREIQYQEDKEEAKRERKA